MAQAPSPLAGQSGQRFRLGELLLREGLLSTEQLQRGLEEQRSFGGRLGRHLVDLGFVQEQTLLTVLSKQLQIPQIDLDQPGVVSPDARRYARADLTEQWGFCPVAFDSQRNVLIIAVSEPDPGLIANITSQVGMRVEPRIATSESVDRACQRLYYGESATPPIPSGGSAQVRRPTEVSGGPRPGFGRLETSASPSWAPLSIPPPDPPGVYELQQQVERLEKSLTAQSRVLRAMAELLIEKGVFSMADLAKKQSSSK